MVFQTVTVHLVLTVVVYQTETALHVTEFVALVAMTLLVKTLVAFLTETVHLVLTVVVYLTETALHVTVLVALVAMTLLV